MQNVNDDWERSYCCLPMHRVLCLFLYAKQKETKSEQQNSLFFDETRDSRDAEVISRTKRFASDKQEPYYRRVLHRRAQHHGIVAVSKAQNAVH